MKTWLTNGLIAWEIPPGRIANFYLREYYLPPAGWQVTDELDLLAWHRGEMGELRREMVVCTNE